MWAPADGRAAGAEKFFDGTKASCTKGARLSNPTTGASQVAQVPLLSAGGSRYLLNCIECSSGSETDRDQNVVISANGCL